jgi:meiotically up-regulated gene 157 (Mug157) protein
MSLLAGKRVDRMKLGVHQLKWEMDSLCSVLKVRGYSATLPNSSRLYWGISIESNGSWWLMTACPRLHCSVLKLGRLYYEATADASPFDARW